LAFQRVVGHENGVGNLPAELEGSARVVHPALVEIGRCRDRECCFEVRRTTGAPAGIVWHRDRTAPWCPLCCRPRGGWRPIQPHHIHLPFPRSERNIPPLRTKN